MSSTNATGSNPFFRRRTLAQRQADARFSAACDALAAALENERQNPSPELRRAREAAEKVWEEARNARDQAKNTTFR